MSHGFWNYWNWHCSLSSLISIAWVNSYTFALRFSYISLFHTKAILMSSSSWYALPLIDVSLRLLKYSSTIVILKLVECLFSLVLGFRWKSLVFCEVAFIIWGSPSLTLFQVCPVALHSQLPIALQSLPTTMRLLQSHASLVSSVIVASSETSWFF